MININGFWGVINSFTKMLFCIPGLIVSTDATKCNLACSDGNNCGGPRGAISVYMAKVKPSTPLIPASTLLYDKDIQAVSTARGTVSANVVETGTEVYLQVTQGDFTCSARNTADTVQVRQAGGHQWKDENTIVNVVNLLFSWPGRRSAALTAAPSTTRSPSWKSSWTTATALAPSGSHPLNLPTFGCIATRPRGPTLYSTEVSPWQNTSFRDPFCTHSMLS